MSKLLDGKVAIITGAGSGIGRASALRFAAEGAKLVLGDRNDSVFETARLVGDAASACQMDAGKEEDVASLVALALATHGRIDVAFAKTGVINLAQVSAQQLSDTRVRVNALCPGLTETGMTKPTFDYAKEKNVMHKVGRLNPLRRSAQAEELAEVALFLSSDLSSHVNGQAIAVDGGLSSPHPVTRQLTGQTAV